ncbi:hypothetical protein ACOMHN_059178 [Nucella lapillus]
MVVDGGADGVAVSVVREAVLLTMLLCKPGPCSLDSEMEDTPTDLEDRGITNACKSINLQLSLVVRLEETIVDEAKRILKDSQLPIVPARDLDDAARKAVASLS